MTNSLVDALGLLMRDVQLCRQLEPQDWCFGHIEKCECRLAVQEKSAKVRTALVAAFDDLFSQPTGLDEKSCREAAETAFIRSLEEQSHGA